MKPFLVLAKNPETGFIKRLIEEVGDSRVLLWNPWKDAQPPAPNLLCIVRTTGVYGDDRDLEVLQSYSGEVLNSLVALQRFRRKSTQYEFCRAHGIAVLPWFVLHQLEEAKLNHWLRSHPAAHYLCKPDRGQGGRGITIHAEADLRSWVERQRTLGDLDYVVQPFVRGASEYRTFFIDDERWTLERTPAPGTVTANFQQAGSAKLVAGAPAAEVERLIARSEARYGAVDFFMCDDACFVLELNVAPGIAQLEAVTGENVMAKLVRKLLSSH